MKKRRRRKTISLFYAWKINQLIYLKWIYSIHILRSFVDWNEMNHWFLFIENSIFLLVFVQHSTVSCYQGGLNNRSTSQWARFQFVLLVLWCWCRCWLVWHGSTSTRRSFAWISHSHSRLARRVFFSFPHFHALCGHKKKGTSHKKTLALEILLSVAVAGQLLLPLCHASLPTALWAGPQINSKLWRERERETWRRGGWRRHSWQSAEAFKMFGNFSIWP